MRDDLVRESCACGATFELHAYTVTQHAAQWRAEHQHIERPAVQRARLPRVQLRVRRIPTAPRELRGRITRQGA